ncbi:unnamed protein product [Triticum aestivum]|uniref:Uncharacterized protein n=1 Tax=Triticum aestivum TaxID=4565 RepID=A0A7H4LCQ7_WHEAT|nr:unnamed protein product [Triticum aestivum]
MNRRFVNLLVNRLCAPRPAYRLHCIDPATLFYPTGSPQPADPAAINHSAPAPAPAPGRLPAPTISFDWPCKPHQSGWMDFMAFKNNIIAVDHEGRTLLYNTASRAVRALNPMQPPLRSYNIFVTVGDSLYVMATEAGLRSRLIWFHALIYGQPPDFIGQQDWYWRPLDLPCFDYEGAHYKSDLPHSDYDSDADDDWNADYTDSADGTNTNESPHPCAICAYTVVGNSQIWVSTLGAGTYSFDIMSGTWSKVGTWVLPFRGRAVYVPEHNLWFGFSDKDDQLCAVDLALTQPVLQKVLEDPPLPEACSPMASHLLHLGSGKLCVQRLFQKTQQGSLLQSVPSDEKDEGFAVLAGVEVRRDDGIGDLQMIKHKSMRYGFDENGVKLL